MKKLVILITIWMMILVPAGKTAAQTDGLDYLVDFAVQNNPGIKAAFHKWKAQEHKIKSVKSLPDPIAKYGYFGESVQTRTGPQDQRYGVSQKVPFPGKLALKGKAQAKQAEIYREKYEAKKREVIKNIKFIYYDLYWIDQAIEVNEEEKTLLDSLEKVLRRKYESDLSPQQDVVKIQLEISKLEDKLEKLLQQRNSLVVRLNTTINRDPTYEIPRIQTVVPLLFEHSSEDLQKLANLRRQELTMAQLKEEKARFEESLAKKSRLPDFNVGFEVIEIGSGSTSHSDDGKDAWLATISMNIPIWFNKIKSQIMEKREARLAAEFEKDDVQNEVVFEVQDAFFKIETYDEIINLYETALIPQAELSFNSVRVAYESNQTDFLNWLEAERQYLKTRLAYYKSVVDYNKTIAYLERIVGQDL